MAINRIDGTQKALDILGVSLQSGSIKLAGSHVDIANAKRNADADVAYIAALLDGLQKHINGMRTEGGDGATTAPAEAPARPKSSLFANS